MDNKNVRRSFHTGDGDSVSSTFETTSDPPDDTYSSSVFGDSLCGEPLLAQHAMLDFTPEEDLDNEFVQKKCVAFWKLINSQPQLQCLVAPPVSRIYSDELESRETLSFTGMSGYGSPIRRKEKTAVSMLEFVEEKGLIDRAFEAKLPKSHCSVGLIDYSEGDDISQKKKKNKQVSQGSQSAIASKCKSCKNKGVHDQHIPASSALHGICRKFERWDMKHPKSLDPPGHPPALSHCIMQRKISS